VTVKVLYAKSPRWADYEKTSIDLIVKFSHIPQEIKFTATADDVEKYGRDLFEKAKAGEYGPISAPELIEPTLIFAKGESVTIHMRQLRLALLDLNLLDTVKTVIENMEDSPSKQKIKIEWEYSTEINRNDEWINDLLLRMQLSKAQIDKLFFAASNL
jgi:hypothetical protein